MSRLVLVRHGRTAWNAEGRWQGQTDVPLDDTGRDQARVMADAVAARYTPHALWCSDLTRAVQTAALVAAATGLTPTPDPRLREIYTGDWEGLTASEIERRWPEDHRRWLAGEDIVRAGGAETRAEVAERTATALEAIAAAAAPDATSVVVGHGASLRAGAARLVGLPIDRVALLGGLRNCSWVELGDPAADAASSAFGRAPGWVVDGWNLSATPPAVPTALPPTAAAVPVGVLSAPSGPVSAGGC